VPTARHAWYDCACCPPNGMRFLASLEHYFVTRTDQGAQFHQYASCRVKTNPGSEGSLDLAVETDYPNAGTVVFRVDAAPAASREIALRVPSWATHATATLNGRSVGGEPGADGYLRLRREWSGGDELAVEFPLRPRVVRASDDIDGARGCVAFERGPLVYCVEGHDLASEHPLRDISVWARVPKEEPGVDIGGQQMVALKLQGRARSTGTPPWPYFDASSEAGGKVTLARATVASSPAMATSRCALFLTLPGPTGARLICVSGCRSGSKRYCYRSQEPARGTGQAVRRSLTSPGLRKGFPSCFQMT